MASGLFAEEWCTLTLKDGVWRAPDGVESIEEELKGRGLHLVAPSDTEMEMFRQAQKWSHEQGNGMLRFSLTEGKVGSVTLNGLGEAFDISKSLPLTPPIVGVNLIGDMLSVGVHDKKRRVYMHVDGTGEKAFQRHLKNCIDFEPINKQGECLVSLVVSPVSTIKESLKALEIVKKQSKGKLLFETGFNSAHYVFPDEWRYPGMVGQSLLDPRVRIDLRLEYNAKNQRVTVLGEAGNKLRNGDELRAYYKDKFKQVQKEKKPLWLCLEGTPEVLSYFGKSIARVAADVGIDFVVCRAPGTKLNLESLDVDEYVFCIDDLQLSEDARFKSRPIKRTLPGLAGGASVNYPMIFHVSKDKIWANYEEGVSPLPWFKQRVLIYLDGSAAAEVDPIVLISFDSNVSAQRVRKVLESVNWDITPLVIYQDLNGNAPDKENRPERFSADFGNIEEYERLEKVFK